MSLGEEEMVRTGEILILNFELSVILKLVKTGNSLMIYKDNDIDLYDNDDNNYHGSSKDILIY